MDKLPPYSEEAEQGVLACILLSADTMASCVEKFKPGPVVFYDLRHQVIYSAMLEMFSERKPIDTITLHQWLKDKQQLDECGGLSYIAPLPDKIAGPSNITHYQAIVLDKYSLRRLIQTCGDVITRVYENEKDVDAFIDECETDVLKISQERETARGRTIPIKELMHQSINTIERCVENPGGLTGISTGYPDLDRMTGGLQKQEMIVLAGRPSMGKTSLGMNIAEHVAVDQKLPVGVFSLEMGAEALSLRLLCSRARVNFRSIREGLVAQSEYPKISNACTQIANAPLYIDDTSGLTILQLRAKARRMWQQYGIKLFMIDYIQLLHSVGRRNDNRQQELTEISAGIKELAKELSVPVIVLAQLNRDMEKERKRKPRPSDLRESGAIEQDADLIGLLYKADSEDDDNIEAPVLSVNLLIGKNRNGACGDVRLTFLRQFTRFESAARF
jgi:replicative DNA helicase